MTRGIRNIIRNPIEPDHSLEQTYNNLIYPGPPCKRVNGKFCHEAGFKNDERWAEELIRHARDRISGLLNESGGKVPNFNIGIFFCGIESHRLFPRLVVSCNHIGEVRRLEKELFGECVSSAHSWLIFEISRDFPRGEVPHLADDNGTNLEASGLQLSGQSSSSDLTSDADSEPPSTEDQEHLHGLTFTWNVYVLETMCENNRITLPTDAFIGLSPEDCTIATLGGLLYFQTDVAPHALTVAHAISATTDSTRHACLTSENPSIHESTGNSDDPSKLQPPQLTPVGKVVRLPDPKFSDVDWAIVRFDEEFQINQRDFKAPLNLSESMFFHPEDNFLCHQEVSIHRKLDIIYGWLGPYPCYIRTDNDPYFVKAYPIQLKNTFCMGMWNQCSRQP